MERARTPPSWAPYVRVVPNEPVREELSLRRQQGPRRRLVRVTDLLDIRSAFYREIAPVPTTPERRARMEAGRELHAVIGANVALARFREVRIQREGIVGQVDLLEDRPAELKTTAQLPEAETLVERRPSYLEQLGMYCALVGQSEGRLILAAATPDGIAEIGVYDCRFDPLSDVFDEMVRRAERLRAAIEARSAAGLPACAWRGRGCEFEEFEVCECTGEERSEPSQIIAALESLEANPAVRDALRDRLRAPVPSPPAVRRFRDLLYPRQTYYARTFPPTPGGAEEIEPPPAGGEDLYRVVTELLELGPAGEVTRIPTPSGVPSEAVACFQGDPFLLKISRAWRSSSSEELLAGQPHYFLDLGIRCAALGRNGGWLFLGYERADRWEDRLRVFRVDFDPVAAFGEMAAERTSSIDRAIASRDPAALPACPGWMFARCDYRSVCGCGEASDASGRDQR